MRRHVESLPLSLAAGLLLLHSGCTVRRCQRDSKFYTMPASRKILSTHDLDQRSRRQAFSENVIGDHDVAWLNERLAESVPEAEFWFYFRDLSADPLKDCKAVLSRIGMAAILPVVRMGTQREGVLRSN